MKSLCFAPGNSVQQAKAKKFASSLGSTKVIHFLRISFLSYPESRQRALRGLARRSSRSHRRFLRILNYFLLKLQYNWSRKYFEKHDEIGIVWNGLKSERLVFAYGCKDAKRKIYFLEESPIPNTLTVDPIGVNYKNSLPRHSEFYVEWSSHNPQPATTWELVSNSFVARAPREKSLVDGKGATHHANAAQGKYIFCPLQVPKDSQIQYFSGFVRNIDNLIDILHNVAAHLPEGWHIRLKEHPSSETRFTEKIQALSHDKFMLDNATDTFELVKGSNGVITVNSSLGLQSLFFQKPVIVLGKAFYNVEPVTYSANNPEELEALLQHPDRLKWHENETTAYLNYILNEYYTFKLKQ